MDFYSNSQSWERLWKALYVEDDQTVPVNNIQNVRLTPPGPNTQILKIRQKKTIELSFTTVCIML
jgi:hypothetical protein